MDALVHAQNTLATLVLVRLELSNLLRPPEHRAALEAVLKKGERKECGCSE